MSRFKGLGEMDWQELGETTMNPATRSLLQVSVEDAAIADEIFSTPHGRRRRRPARLHPGERQRRALPRHLIRSTTDAPCLTKPQTLGNIEPIEIQEEMERSFLDYAMSVITARALPDARDGLKPVQRRILYGMYAEGMRPDRPHRKCANAVGEVMGKYHPHGDQSIYDALARMAQDFSLRYPLIDGHGNFGSPERPARPRRATPRRGCRRSRWSCSARSTRTPSTSATTYDGRNREPLVRAGAVPEPAW